MMASDTAERESDREGKAAGTRELLRHRALRLLLLADLVDNAGSWAFKIVFTVVVFDRTHSATWVAAATVIGWVPALLLGSFAGVLADRYQRGRLMIMSAAVSAVLMGVLALGVAAGVPLAVLIVLTALQSTVATVYSPAFGASLPDVVPERLLAGANGLREVIYNAAIVAGPALGALLLLTGKPAVGIAFNALTFLVPIAVVVQLKVSSRGGGEAGANPITELVDGIRALAAQRTAAVLFVAMVLDSGLAAVNTAIALPIVRYVGGGANAYGYLLVASAFGSVVVAGFASKLAGRGRLAAILVVALLAQAIPYTLLVAAPHLPTAFVVMFATGAGMIVVDLVAITALQRDVPSAYLGRIFGLLEAAIRGVGLVFAMVAGTLISSVGTSTSLLIVGFGASAIVVATAPLLVATDRRTAARAAQLAPIVRLLRSLDLFDGADRPTLERLAIAADEVSVPGGTVLIREGDPAEEIWLLADGELGISSRATGQLPAVTAPGYVGEIGVLHERPRTATVSAVGPCRLFRIAGNDFRDALSGGVASSSLMMLSGQRLARTETRRPTPRRRPRPYPVR